MSYRMSLIGGNSHITINYTFHEIEDITYETHKTIHLLHPVDTAGAFIIFCEKSGIYVYILSSIESVHTVYIYKTMYIIKVIYKMTCK